MGRTDAWMSNAVKRAALGGQGNDAAFQDAFSSVAHAYLQDKAPTLMKFQQGFQLLDREDDNTRSAGVFGFRVGSQQMFVPVFFLNGQLRGHEILHLKNQDAFVPLKENWVNELLGKSQVPLGKNTSRRNPMGVRPPDLSKLVYPPSKAASASNFPWHRFASWSHPFIRTFADVVRPNADEAIKIAATMLGRTAKRMSLPEFFKTADVRHARTFLNWCRLAPAIAEAAARHHGADTMEAVVKAAAARPAPVRDMPAGHLASRSAMPGRRFVDVDLPYKQAAKLRIVYRQITIGSGHEPEDLTQTDRERLMRDTVLIRDNRDDDEVSTPVRVDTGTTLTNPNASGRFKVLTGKNEFDDCIVLTGPRWHGGAAPFVVALRTDGDRSWALGKLPKVWVAGGSATTDAGLAESTYDDWFEGVESTSEPSVGSTVYVAVGPRGQSTVPFVVRQDLGKSEDGAHTFRIEYAGDCLYGEFDLCGNRPMSFHDEDDPYSRRVRLHFGATAGSKITIDRTNIFVPKTFKIVRLGKPEEEAEDDSPCCPKSIDHDEGKLQLADMSLRQSMYAQTIGESQKKAGNEEQLLDNPRLRGELAEVIRQYVADPQPELSPTAPSSGPGVPTPPPPPGGAPPMDPAAMGAAPPMDPAMMGGGAAPPPMGPAAMGAAPPMDPAMMGAPPPTAAAAPVGPKMAMTFGTPDAYRLRTLAGTAELKIARDGSDYYLNAGRPLTLTDALVSLVKFHGFREKVARELLREVAGGSPVLRLNVKYAASPYLTPGAEADPPPPPREGGANDIGTDVPTFLSGADVKPVSSMDPGQNDLSGYDLKDMPPAWLAENSGGSQAEGFDAAAIGSMLRAVNDESTIDRYLPAIFDGMDAIGRVLMMSYWHQDAFADRFGKQDMPELTDSLRNQFEGNGDLYLFLKHKSAQPFDLELSRGFDLKNVA